MKGAIKLHRGDKGKIILVSRKEIAVAEEKKKKFGLHLP